MWDTINAWKVVVFMCQNSAERPGIFKLMKHPWITLYQRPHSSCGMHPPPTPIHVHSHPPDGSLSTSEHCDADSKEELEEEVVCTEKCSSLEIKSQNDVGTTAGNKSESSVESSKTSQDNDTATQDIAGPGGDYELVVNENKTAAPSSCSGDICVEGRSCLEPPTGILSKTVVPIHSAVSKAGGPMVPAPSIPSKSYALPMLSGTSDSTVSVPQSAQEGEKRGVDGKEKKVRIGGHQLHRILSHRVSSSTRTQNDLKDEKDDQNAKRGSHKGKRSTGGKVLEAFGFKQASRRDSEKEFVVPRVCSMTTLNLFNCPPHQTDRPFPRQSPAEEDAEVDFSEDPSLDVEPSPPSWTLSHPQPSLRPAHRLNREITASHLSFSSTSSSLMAESKDKSIDKATPSALHCVAPGVEENPGPGGDEANERLPNIRSPSIKRSLAPMSASAYERCNLLSGDE